MMREFKEEKGITIIKLVYIIIAICVVILIAELVILNKDRIFSKNIETTDYENEYRYGDNSYKEGMMIVYRNGKYGYIGKNHRLAISCIYTRAKSFSEGLAAVRNEEKNGDI